MQQTIAAKLEEMVKGNTDVVNVLGQILQAVGVQAIGNSLTGVPGA